MEPPHIQKILSTSSKMSKKKVIKTSRYSLPPSLQRCELTHAIGFFMILKKWAHLGQASKIEAGCRISTRGVNNLDLPPLLSAKGCRPLDTDRPAHPSPTWTNPLGSRCPVL